VRPAHWLGLLALCTILGVSPFRSRVQGQAVDASTPALRPPEERPASIDGGRKAQARRRRPLAAGADAGLYDARVPYDAGVALQAADGGVAPDAAEVEARSEAERQVDDERAKDERLLREEEEAERRETEENARYQSEQVRRDAQEKVDDEAASAAAQAAAPEYVPDFVDALPDKLQDVVTNAVVNMVVSRSPPDRLLYSVFGLPRSRFGSGTTWLPDASPLYAAVPHLGKWGLLIHGNLYTGYNWYSSERGWQRFMGRNTLMGALFRTFQRSEVMFRLALSFEPLTIGSRGYPQVLQTGQTTNGNRIHDKMYALDFFRELALTYSWEVTPRWAATVYAALAGEPALGPVTFTQRISASADPLAPLGFQAQEQSHASFGVLTVGAYSRTLKVEASWFNGEVPGNRRYGLYLRKPDSYSLRVNWNPRPQWSGQVSYGFLEQPVAREPNRSQHRVSVSATYTQWHADSSGLSSTASFAERITVNGDISTAFMLEAYWNIDGHHSVFGRAELLQKSGEELVLPEPSNELFAVGSIASGYVYYFGPWITLAPGLGVRVSINPMEDDLARFYGTHAAWGLMAFAQLRTAVLPTELQPQKGQVQ
jgi:hypothetical protein